ncbi:hypothetical protein MATL_G00069180 [Megalops atlanticus]|uniref:TNFR-Cys domain-containing protein n=1 Tax=Megalops atlanticus TaxID=7932 RepID=A0A9D3TEK4_MEGAT|nr:hypothetical protein MATL_G00069180 [Megalops atlanticus]
MRENETVGKVDTRWPTQKLMCFKMKLCLAFISVLSLLLETVTKKCQQSEFLTEKGHCCRLHNPGYYIIKNCTKETGNAYTPCTSCTGTGKKKLVDCTLFSDAVCGCKDGFTLAPSGDCEPVTKLPNITKTTPTTQPAAGLIASLIVMIILITISVLMGRWLCKARNTDGFLKTPQLV